MLRHLLMIPWVLVPLAAEAQVVVDNPYDPIIGGVRVYCINSDTGERVRFISDHTIGDIGYATGDVIALNPIMLAQLPPKLQLFWYGHECGHHALGMAVAATFEREDAADKWSIQTGREQGLFSREDVVGFAPYFANNPGSPWGHAPGPERAANLVGYFDDRDESAGVAVSLRMWPVSQGDPAEMEVYVNGSYAGYLNNVEGEEVIDLGDLQPGMHDFELDQIAGYRSTPLGLQPYLTGGTCNGRFLVADRPRLRLIVIVQATASGIQCAIQ